LMLAAGYPKALIPFHVPNNITCLCVSPLSFHMEILLYQNGQSALDTSRTLFLLASTQGASCRLVMNHLIYVYVLSHPPTPTREIFFFTFHHYIYLWVCVCTFMCLCAYISFPARVCLHHHYWYFTANIQFDVLLLCINHICYLYMPSRCPDLVNKLISISISNYPLYRVETCKLLLT
jgi:hypothetical protein